MTLALLAFVATLGALACGEKATYGGGTQGNQRVHGLIREVKSSSVTELETLVLQDEGGTRWRLEARSTKLGGFTPSHLREDMVLGLPATVTFHREDGALVLDDITD